MEILIVAFILALICGGGFLIINSTRALSELRDQEEQKMQELFKLKKQAAELRKDIQDYEIGNKYPAESFSEKESHVEKPLENVNCYFCDEPILPVSLICKYCKNPNYYNLDMIIKHEIELINILKTGG